MFTLTQGGDCVYTNTHVVIVFIIIIIIIIIMSVDEFCDTSLSYCHSLAADW